MVRRSPAPARALLPRTRISHFEVTRPSLHDIFVRIASPEDEAARLVELATLHPDPEFDSSHRPNSARRSGPSRSSSGL